MAERRVSGKGAHGDQAQAHYQVELLTRCNVKHEQEHEEEHHGAAQVLLEHHDDHGHAPHEQERQQRSDVWQVERAHSHGEHGQQLAVLGQIACHEQHDDDLGDLVLPHLVQGHINTRIDSARTLGQIRFEAALPQIVAGAGDPRWEMRAVVATALGAFGEQENEETLIKLLCDREWWVRYRAAESLTKATDTKELLARVEKTGDRFAAEMMRFALEQAALIKGEAA